MTVKACDSCLVCGATSLKPLIDIPDVPALCNRLCVSEVEAANAPRGDISLLYCVDCGHVFNSAFEYVAFEPEHSGPDLAASAWKSSGLLAADVSPAWNDPPPVTPDNLEPLHRWQEATAARLATELE